MTIDDRIAAIEERVQIEETIGDLFTGTDARDWRLVERCFAPRVHFDMASLGAGPAREVAREEITRAWETGLSPLQAVHHQVGNLRVRLAGERAEAFCYGIAIHYLPNARGANTRTFVGSYDFTLAPASGRWEITHFRFNLKFLDGNPELENG